MGFVGADGSFGGWFEEKGSIIYNPNITNDIRILRIIRKGIIYITNVLSIRRGGLIILIMLMLEFSDEAPKAHAGALGAGLLG